MRCSPPGSSSSPQGKTAPSSPPRAAYSHSASVGSRLPAQAQKAGRRPTRRAPRGARRGRRGRSADPRVAPVGALDLAPPGRLRDGAGGGKSSGRRPPKTNEQPTRSASVRSPSPREAGEVGVGDRAGVDPERVEGDLPDGPLAVRRVRMAILAAHQEGAAVQPHHAVRGAGRGCRGGRAVRGAAARPGAQHACSPCSSMGAAAYRARRCGRVTRAHPQRVISRRNPGERPVSPCAGRRPGGNVGRRGDGASTPESAPASEAARDAGRPARRAARAARTGGAQRKRRWPSVTLIVIGAVATARGRLGRLRQPRRPQHPDNFTDVSVKMLEDPEIRQAVSVYLVDQIWANATSKPRSRRRCRRPSPPWRDRPPRRCRHTPCRRPTPCSPPTRPRRPGRRPTSRRTPSYGTSSTATARRSPSRTASWCSTCGRSPSTSPSGSA